MATVTLNIPSAVLARVVDALCQSAGLPVSAENAKAALIDHIRATVANVEQSAAVVTPPPVDVSAVVIT